MVEQGLVVTADGEILRGVSVGAEGVATGEGVFDTSMMGYQEVLTDPSFAGQVVVMTTAHLGNYGVTPLDDQAAKPWVSGFVIRALSRRYSNWRAEGSLGDYLRHWGIVTIADVDTRRLTRHIRDRGSQPVAIGVGVTEAEMKELASSAPKMEGRNLVDLVTTGEAYFASAKGERKGSVVAIDLGMKRCVIDDFTSKGLDVEVVPATTSAADILARKPTGVFVSSGPGDPEPLVTTVETVKSLLGKTPIFGICLGHQVIGLALGAKTYKLPFGHHGGNHPVKRFSNGRVEITAHNHGFTLDLWSLTGSVPPKREGLVTRNLLPESVVTDFGVVRPTHQSLNDGTLEGLECDSIPAFSVQFHPEAAPGPNDSRDLLENFAQMMGIEGANEPPASVEEGGDA